MLFSIRPHEFWSFSKYKLATIGRFFEQNNFASYVCCKIFSNDVLNFELS